MHGAWGSVAKFSTKHASIIRSPREGLMGGLQASYDVPEVRVAPLSPGANRVAIFKIMVYSSYAHFRRGLTKTRDVLVDGCIGPTAS